MGRRPRATPARPLPETSPSEPTTYKITLYAISAHGSIPISSEEFNEIRRATRRLVFGVGIEEKLDMILENYAELERTLFDMALTHSLFLGKIHDLLDESTLVINRRVVNLLTTTRLYLDQVRHDFSAAYGRRSEPYEKLKDAIRNEDAAVPAYRVMEALRNYAQHRSLPTHGVVFPVSREESFEPALIRFGVGSLVDVSVLEEDPAFNPLALGRPSGGVE